MTSISTTAYYTLPARYVSSEKTSPKLGDDYAGMVKRSAVDGKSDGSAGSSNQNEADSGPSSVTRNFQGKLVNLNVMDLSKPEKFDPARLPEDRYKDYLESEKTFLEMDQRSLEIQFTQRSYPDLSNDPRTKPYANIVVGGKVVATIDNQGVVGTNDDILGQKLQSLLLSNVNGTNGPDLAQARAEQLANMLGGRVVQADTAIDQSKFASLSSMDPTEFIDYDAMRSDSRYEDLQRRYAEQASLPQRRAEYLSQASAA